ncbi:uncharacterized protein LOC125312443 isoform X3 [Rhodamnia argentea]|uniref:Uncharacterized protein LOC125312443 isoform X3 n=1 Tax=Rhodamnia argentea TaxID=178133 RepID=A0ABM3GTE9_9MYRT|nr:uncharacterized protein LOC125312443 isoform X3 [Rhodamnia argentea]
MESNVMRDAVEIEEEYVLLDLDSVSEQFDILPNAPYVLSGLDTLSPILVIDNKLKLIGHYEETIGTCIALTEEGESSPIVPEEIGPSEVNKSSGRCNMNPNLCPSKQVKPVACIDKILKFKLLVDTNVPDASAQP